MNREASRWRVTAIFEFEWFNEQQSTVSRHSSLIHTHKFIHIWIPVAWLCYFICSKGARHTQLQLHNPHFSIVNLCANYMHFYAAKSTCLCDPRERRRTHSETCSVLATISHNKTGDICRTRTNWFFRFPWNEIKLFIFGVWRRSTQTALLLLLLVYSNAMQ